MWRVQELIDVRSGLWAAGVMGSLVAWINLNHGVGPATIAALKQAVYTFFFGGAVIQLCNRLSVRKGPEWRVLLVAVTVPWIGTTLATLFVHSLRGTPEPLLSTLPVALLTPPILFVWARRTRKAAVGAVLAGGQVAAEG